MGGEREGIEREGESSETWETDRGIHTYPALKIGRIYSGSVVPRTGQIESGEIEWRVWRDF